jgi:hypothetical protein
MATAIAVVATLSVLMVLEIGFECLEPGSIPLAARLARVRALRFSSGIVYAATSPVVGVGCVRFFTDEWPRFWAEPDIYGLSLVMLPFLIFFCFTLTAFPVLVAYSCFTWRPPTSAPEAPSQ